MKRLIVIYSMLICPALYGQKSAARMIIQSGHFDEILSMAYSPNGNWVATGGKDRLVVLYDVKTGMQMAALKGLEDWVEQLEFTADNTKIIGLSTNRSNHWSGVRVWDVGTGNLVCSIEKPECGHIQSFRQCGASNRLMVMADGVGCLTFFVYDLTTGKKIKEFAVDQDPGGHWAVTPDAKTMVFEDKKARSISVVNVVTGTVTNTFPVNDLENARTDSYDVVYLSDDGRFYHRSMALSKWLKISTTTGEISSTQFDGIAKESPEDVHMNVQRTQLYVNYGSRVRVFSLPDLKMEDEIELSVPYASFSAASHHKKMMAFAYQRNVYFYDMKHKEVVREFIASPCKPLQAIFSNNSRTIAIADYYSPTKIWDIQSADAVKPVERVSLNSPRHDLMRFSPDDKVLLTFGSFPQLIHIPTLENKIYCDHFYIKTKSYLFRTGCDAVTPDFTKVLVGSTQFELATGRVLGRYKTDPYCDSGIWYSPDGQFAYSSDHSYEEDSIRIFVSNTDNCSLRITYKLPDDGERGKVSISDNSKLIGVAGDGITIADFLTGKVLYVYSQEDIAKKNKDFTELYSSALDFSPDGKMLAVADRNTNAIGIFSVETGKAVHVLRGHDDMVYTLAYSPDGKKIVSVGEDKKVLLWNAEKGTLDVTFVPVDESDYVAFTPDNYYMCSKSGLKGVAYRVKNKMLKAEQFDLRQNRPDTVLQRIGYATKFSLKMYKKAWKKRIQKAGYTEEMLGADYHVPEIEILKADEIPGTTSDSKLSFEIKLSDSLYQLSKYNVYINDVPVYGSKGFSIKSESLKETTRLIELDLTRGRNVVQVTVFNEKGTESIRQSFEIFCSKRPETKPDLYIFAIGVSNYKDKSRDLKFAAKDAKDLTGYLKNNIQSFDSVHVKLLTGTEATRANVLAASSFFKKAGINDEVILYFSGHGLLNDELSYYLAMYDVDFNKPESGGLPYEEFEGLIDNIVCRNRLVLLDACHSGEVDKEETVVSTSTALNVTSGARSGGMNVKPKVGLKNTLGLMRELFTETQKGSGATILSAAGGMEYALESADWNNGVFTYAILDALKDNKADSNNDKVVKVSELCNFVSKKVYHLTRGAQSPNARKENTQNNFIVR